MSKQESKGGEWIEDPYPQHLALGALVEPDSTLCARVTHILDMDDGARL